MSRLSTTVTLKEAIRLMLEKGPAPVKAPAKGGRRPGIDKSGAWVAWPKSSLAVKYEPSGAGIGPGEARLAWMMGGEVMGGSVSHDIEAGDGTAWEVKEPKGGSIRAGTESTAASTGMRQSIENVTKRIARGIKSARKALDFRKFMAVEDYQKIVAFIEQDAPMIMKAEIPPERMKRLLDVMLIINSAMQGEVKDKGEDAGAQKYVELGDEEQHVKKDVDLATYIKVGQAADVPDEELKVSDKEMFAAFFNTPAFRDPQTWFQKTWQEGVKASAVFGHCDGVILVSKDQYRVILKAQLDTEMPFLSLTQARAKFRVK